MEKMQSKIYVVGIGPGDTEMITPAVQHALKQADVIVGYHYYVELIASLIEGKREVATGMKRERERAHAAIAEACDGHIVAVVSSGDAGIYGMASLVLELTETLPDPPEVVVLPGISAFQAAAARLGAPISHDFCSISLSDLMTPWNLIERRITAAASADFVTAVYNPRSKGRYWQMKRMVDLFLQHRDPDTPVGIVRQASRQGETAEICRLDSIPFHRVDMFTMVIIGNSQSRISGERMITPRGYLHEVIEEERPGQQIMTQSFATIYGLLKNKKVDSERLWVLLHCIHTTADFSMEEILYLTEGVIQHLHDAFNSGKPPVIITDVTMVKSGIRKAALQRLGIEVKCYLQDERTAMLAAEKGITRTQAGIRLAVQEHPDALFAFGNAPTALMELADLMRKGLAKPVGIIAAPVGFVNVEESKHRITYLDDTPKVVVQGRKGGSNVAATIINAIFSFEQAVNMTPGIEV